MAESGVDIVRSAFEASAGGAEEMLAYVHPEFEMTTPGQIAAEPGTYRGHDGVRRWFDTFYEVMDRVALKPIEVVATARGDRVAVEFDLVARGRSSGIEAIQRAVALCALTDEKLSRIEFYATLPEAIEAAGGFNPG